MLVLGIDTETGGDTYHTDALLEIGAAVYDITNLLFEEVSTYQSYILPNNGLRITPEALDVNKLSIPMLKTKGKEESEVLKEFLDWGTSQGDMQIIVGWNISFDINFIKSGLKRSGLQWPRRWYSSIDVQSLWSYHNLTEGVMKFRGITQAAQEILKEPVVHGALEDIQMTFRILERMMKSD